MAQSLIEEMEDSRSSMKDDQIGHVGDDSISANTHPEDGWSEEEFDVRTH